MALEKLNELNILGLDKHANMQTEVARPPQTAVSRDSTSENGLSPLPTTSKNLPRQ